MKIGLVDVDGHSGYPNYALMKISAWHKMRGDDVEFANGLFGKYDRVYKSKVFTFTKDDFKPYDCEVIKGGTGYDFTVTLPDEIDRLQPDYSLYGINGVSYGFITRGCPNKCPWCIVPKKEGKERPYMTIEEIAGNNKEIILMDNNVLSSDYGLGQIEIASRHKYRLDFNQGLDARLITDDVAKLLASCRWIKYIRVACDKSMQIKHVLNALDLLRKNGYKRELFCYCLLQDFEETTERVKTLYAYRDDITLYCQPYRDFDNPHQRIPQWQKDLAHWADKKSLYKSIPFEEFKPRKGFVCRKYFEDENLVKKRKRLPAFQCGQFAKIILK